MNVKQKYGVKNFLITYYKYPNDSKRDLNLERMHPNYLVNFERDFEGYDNSNLIQVV